MIDLSKTIIPKSDQMNADDLISGPRTITITKISVVETADQPVTINYQGDDGKPWKPCKSMRRVLVYAWGLDGTTYIGRSLTVFRDPNAMFGGQAVGGIRISHMSHIEKQIIVALTVSRAKRAPFIVKPLESIPPEKTSLSEPHMIPVSLNDDHKPDWTAWASTLGAAIKTARSRDEVDEWLKTNNSPIRNLGRDAPRIADHLSQSINERKAALEWTP